MAPRSALGQIDLFSPPCPGSGVCGSHTLANFLTPQRPAPVRKSLLPGNISPITTVSTNVVTIIDAMVVYTPEARLGAGGAAAIESMIDLAMAEANTVFQNSRAHVRLRLAYRGEVNYVEHSSLSTNLNRLQAKNDGFLDDVHGLRSTNRADVVCLVTESSDPGLSGLAFTMGDPSLAFSDFAFAIVKRSELVGTHMFVHEIGHVLGAQHDRENSLDETGKLKPGAYPYSHAYRFQVNGVEYRTVMAHEPGQLIPFFSNPDILFEGVPIGLAGTTNGANNALTLNMTGLLVGSFMGLAVQTVPPAVRISSPGDGQVYRSGTNITASIIASDSDSLLQRVELYVGNRLIGISTGPILTNIVLGLTTNTLPITNLTYSITWSNVPPGEFKLTARAIDAPGASSVSLSTGIIVRPNNDPFVDRVVLTDAEPTVTASNRAATREPNEPEHTGNPGGSSVWYSWTAPRTSTMVVLTTGNGILPLTEVYRSLTSTTSTTVSREFEFDKTNFVARTTFDAISGLTYSIAVDAAGGKGGEFTLRLFVQPPPANDNYANREAIAGETVHFVANNAYATLEPDEPKHAAPNANGKSVWYSWTAPRSAPAVVTVRAATFFPLADVYTNLTATILTNVPGRTVSVDTTNKLATLTFDAVQGEQYRIAVVGFADLGGEFQFELRLPPPPPNDNFADRILLDGTTVSFETSNKYSTVEPGEPAHPQLKGGRSIWYGWKAPVSGPVTVTARGDTFYPFVLAYTGSAPNLLTNVPSAAIKFDTNLVSILTFNATAFQTYVLGLDGFNAHSGVIQFNLKTANVPPSLKSFARENATGPFTLVVDGSVGQKFLVQSSTNLINWTNQFTGTFTSSTAEFRDETAVNFKSRFYRIFPAP